MKAWPALVLPLLLSLACSPGGSPPTSRSADSGPALQPVLVASELAVGEQRVPIGVLERNTPVADASVHVRAYRQAPTDPLLSESDAPFKGDGLLGKGDRKSTRLNSSHIQKSRMPSSA